MKNQRINRGIIDNENASKANTPGYEPGKCCLYPLLSLSCFQSIIKHSFWMEEKGLFSWYIKTEDQIGQMVIMFAFCMF